MVFREREAQLPGGEEGLMSASIENRRSAREILRVPVKIEVLRADDAASKIFLGITSNVSSHGLAIQVPSKTVLNLDASIHVYVDGHSAFRSSRFPAKLSWQADSLLGLEFISGDASVHEVLRKAALSLENQAPFLKKYFSFVGGENIDTRKYEFFPYAERLVSEYAKTRELMVQLKKGVIPPEAASYFYAQYALADSQINYSAVLSAHEAFREYRKFSVQRRLQILDDVRELLEKEKKNLIEILVTEGHPLKTAENEFESIKTCLSETSLNYFERGLESLARSGEETMIGVRRPHGVVCVLPPRNAASVAFMACLTLLAGNTLVLCPPSNMPLSSVYLWKNVFAEALALNGAPKGTLNIVLGDSGRFMDEWSQNPLVKSIFFFGNEVREKPGSSSGKDALLLWKDADLQAAAESLCGSAFSTAFVHQDAFTQFVSALLPKISALEPGLPSSPETDLAPAINEMSLFFELLDRSLRGGGKVLAGGFRINTLGLRDPEGLFLAPTVIEVPFEEAAKFQSSPSVIASPLILLVKVRGGGLNARDMDHEVYDGMTRLLERVSTLSRVSIWVKDAFYMRKFIEDLDHAGSLKINSFDCGPASYKFADGRTASGPFTDMNRVWEKSSRTQWVSVTLP